MHRFSTSFRAGVVALLLAVFGAKPALAHFPWLTTDDQGRALLFFGESLDERNYKLPESVAKAKVFVREGGEKRAELVLPAVEEDEFIGRRSEKRVAKGAVLESTCQYGVYHGMLLTYYAKHLPGADAAAWEKLGPSQGLKLDSTAQVTKEGLVIAVMWDAKPLPEASVALTDSAGDLHESETNNKGEASFEKVAPGPVGTIVSFTNNSAKGELDGKPFTSSGNYGTLSFNYQGAGAEKAAAPAGAASASVFPELPEPVSSFGGAVCDGWLYVYSGHIGTEHDHSRANLSQQFLRIKVNGVGAWEELPMQTPLQGLPLVAHGGKLYRVGGLSAKNAADEEEDIHSVAEFACYDPDTRQWTALPSLPEPRSSHDAAVIGDNLYVIGGWKLAGSRKGKWLDTAWSFDLSKPGAVWEALPSPGFRRRALAAGQWQGKLVAIGGMTDDADISQEVYALDLEAGEWSQLADLPADDEMGAFGVSGWNLKGQLYVSGMQESMYRLAEDGKSWERAGDLEQPRFFHRLLPGSDSTLLAVAGASEDGHLDAIERIRPIGSASKAP